MFYKTKTVPKGGGSLACDTGSELINCVFYSPWWIQPAEVRADGTVETCSAGCANSRCDLSAICLVKSGLFHVSVFLFLITSSRGFISTDILTFKVYLVND